MGRAPDVVRAREILVLKGDSLVSQRIACKNFSVNVDSDTLHESRLALWRQNRKLLARGKSLPSRARTAVRLAIGARRLARFACEEPREVARLGIPQSRGNLL